MLIVAGVAWFGWLAAAGQTAGRPVSAAAHTKQAPQKAQTTAPPQDPGERAFQQNCNRCHNAPQELPRRVTGTVLLHMRVRAGLSEADERAILRYMTQ